LNQYAYRPLLLLLFAAGIGLFGHNDFGAVAPVFFASLVTTALVFVFVRRFIDPRAAPWCALLFALEPFDVVNSTTMTNDVILACLVCASVMLFLSGDLHETAPGRRVRRFVTAGAVMFAAFLVKITLAPVLAALGIYSLVSLVRRPAIVLRFHSLFYGAFLAGIAATCLVYLFLTGDPFWQFKAETHYYQHYKPDWYVAGLIDYTSLMWYYPRSLFGAGGEPSYRYRDHGLLFWALIPAMVILWRETPRLSTLGSGLSAVHALRTLLFIAACVFLFFQFYPQYLSPYYLPLVRQDRYLEMLLPPVVVIVGTALWIVSLQRRLLALALCAVLCGDFVVQAARRGHHFDDSQEDMRALARYADGTIKPTGRPLVVDLPASNSLEFYLRKTPIPIRRIATTDPHSMAGSYVVAGGARSFWWANGLSFDVRPETPPNGWILTYENPGLRRPWRPSNLRVYYVTETPSEVPLFDDPVPAPVTFLRGLAMTTYGSGFGKPPTAPPIAASLRDVDNTTLIPASHLQWDGLILAEDGVYTFETTSDDGSWVELNGKPLLDNGGTHPARTVSRTVRLKSGWYGFRLRYEDAGGDRLLRFRVFKDYRNQPLDPAALFYTSSQ
jgi:hypothetical protein